MEKGKVFSILGLVLNIFTIICFFSILNGGLQRYLYMHFGNITPVVWGTFFTFGVLALIFSIIGFVKSKIKSFAKISLVISILILLLPVGFILLFGIATQWGQSPL